VTPTAAPAPHFDDVYHPASARSAQARHVFLAGNGLPGALGRAARLHVMLETGFGLGHNFLATWEAWRGDAAHAGTAARGRSRSPPARREDLQHAHARAPLPRWPRNCWRLAAAHAGPARAGLRRRPLRLLLASATSRRCCPNCACRPTPSTWTALRPTATRRCGTGGCSRHWRAWRRPAAQPPPGAWRGRSLGRAPALAKADDAERHALIIGGGLAGASAAEALARHGWRCTVLDRHVRPAGEASGNPGGLFHGTAHASDGVHARFTRAAALLAARRHAAGIASGRVDGQCDGLLRLRPSGAVPELPPGYLQAVDPTALQAHTGLPLDEPAWLYPGGGWLSPADLTARCLDHPAILAGGLLAFLLFLLLLLGQLALALLERIVGLGQWRPWFESGPRH
jgi:tRNA 5-methylaminomethyl-2-thiouridine biosynthesis bifunctional protein